MYMNHPEWREITELYALTRGIPMESNQEALAVGAKGITNPDARHPIGVDRAGMPEQGVSIFMSLPDECTNKLGSEVGTIRETSRW